MQVAFINENMLGHSSYLLPFTRMFARRPELGVVPHLISATPLPPELGRQADLSIPGLRRWGLDFHNTRWRLTVSRYVREKLDELRARQPIDAVVVNTQSVGLDLLDTADAVPLLVCLDATFDQLSHSRWFAPNPMTKAFLPLTMAPLRGRERMLFQKARWLFPWSRAVHASLVNEYAIDPKKMSVLPPSVERGFSENRNRPINSRPQILFMGGDFKRKGGPILWECFQRHFADRCDLHLVTQSEVPASPGVFVHRGVDAHSEAWQRRWHEADLFVFPSTLETFGIVLLEALAFGVPVISADVGAAREVLANGSAGWLLPEVTVESLRIAISHALNHPHEAAAKAIAGRQLLATDYDLTINTEWMAGCLNQACA